MDSKGSVCCSTPPPSFKNHANTSKTPFLSGRALMTGIQDQRMPNARLASILVQMYWYFIFVITSLFTLLWNLRKSSPAKPCYHRNANFDFDKWAAMWENVPSAMCAKRRLKSASASAGSDQSSLFAWRKCSLGYRKWAQWRFWPDCANAQADLNPLGAHVRTRVFLRCGANTFKLKLKEFR